MSSKTILPDISIAGGRGGHVRSAAGYLADAAAGMRRKGPAKTARARVSVQSRQPARTKPQGPTPERLAKGDVLRTGGVQRSVSMLERYRDQGLLAPKTPEEIAALRPGEAPYDSRENQGMFEAGLKLRRCYEGCMMGVKAQDLDRVLTTGSELVGEEGWVANYQALSEACRVMGWHPGMRHRGNARIVLAIVCHDMTLVAAIHAHLPPGRLDRNKGVALDRLREGLFDLAKHWRML